MLSPIPRSALSSIVLGSTFNPKDVANLSIYWDVIDSTIGNTGGLVDSISAVAPTTITGSSTTTNRPTLIADDGDGFPCIDSNNKHIDASSGFTNLTEETLFMVVKVVSVGSTVEGIFGGASGNYGLYHTNATTPAQMNMTTASSTTDAVGALRDVWDYNVGNYKILRMRRKVGTGRDGFMELYENGQIIALDTHSSGTESITFRIGARGGTSKGIIKWRTFLHYSRALTDTECFNIEAYLNDKYNVYTVPSWAASSLPQVKRYAIANSIASAAAMPGGTKKFWSLIGDSTTVGYSLKSAYDAKYRAAITNASIYEWNILGDWQGYDSTDSASRTDKGRIQAEVGLDATMSWEITNASAKSHMLKYGILGAAVGDTGDNNNFNTANASTNYPTRLRRYLLKSINEEVALNGTNLVNYGLVTYIGTNDAVDAYYATLQANFTNLIAFYRNIPGMSTTKVAINQIFSNSGSYTRITEARAALVSAAAAISNCQLFSTNDNAAGTVDGTHPNHTQYLSRTAEIYPYLNA